MYGGGGSGEPTSRDDVYGTRSERPNGGSAATAVAASSAPAITKTRVRSAARFQFKAGHSVDEELGQREPGAAVRHCRVERLLPRLLRREEPHRPQRGAGGQDHV